jgi:hypothetical protein
VKDLQPHSPTHRTINLPLVGGLFNIETKNTPSRHAENIIRSGYSIIDLNNSMSSDFSTIQRAFMGINDEDKKSFSFPLRTDGFMPMGLSFARDREKIDLNETFWYWPRFCDEHKKHRFHKHELYSTMSNYEKEVSNIAQRIMNDICKIYGYPERPSIRDHSYLQFNCYREDLRLPHRRYLQDKHEDGHIITVIKPNAPGLVLFIGNMEYLVELSPNQAIVVAGSLLTELSEGDIEPMYHAVLNLTLPAARASLVYNVNILSEKIDGLKTGRKIEIRKIANKHHTEFGHYPYQLD